MEIANLLDPKQYGKDLPSNSMDTISKFIQEYYPKESTTIWTQILQYKNQSGVFSNNLSWASIDAVDSVTWWKSQFQYSASELTKIALCILRIPTSSAASERNWSAFSYIHDKKRNRLTSERVFKLVYIYSNYKLQQPQKCCSIDIDEDENEDNELSEVEGNLNDEVREGEESDNGSNESDTTIELYELGGYEND